MLKSAQMSPFYGSTAIDYCAADRILHATFCVGRASRAALPCTENKQLCGSVLDCHLEKKNHAGGSHNYPLARCKEMKYWGGGYWHVSGILGSVLSLRWVGL